MNKYSPIILFVYTRLDHTKKTIDSLKKNILANESDFFIYSDFSRSDDDLIDVNKMRLYLKTINGFKSIHIIERKENFGLAKNIITGVTEVVNKYGKVIVIEDDIVTSPYFLQYMNDSLLKYKNNEKLISISGYRYPIGNIDNNDDTFVSRMPMCWGWATWESKWNLFEKDLNSVKRMSKEQIAYINFEGTNNFFDQAIDNINGRINTWFIFWYITAVKNKMLTLYPRESLVINVGHDGSGENCSYSQCFDTFLRMSPILLSDIKLEENEKIIQLQKNYYLSLRINLLKRIIRKIKKIGCYYVGKIGKII
jgi:hypothetical protein